MAYNRRLLYVRSVASWDTPEGDLGIFVQNGNPIEPFQFIATEVKEPDSVITYSVTEGSIPNGLSLSSSGEMSGTISGYSSAETVNFSITATDDEGEVGVVSVRSFSIRLFISYPIEYLVVAGGGGGGARFGGGGGAGGFLTSTYNTNSSLTIPISVGAGAPGANLTSFKAANGANSSFGDIVSIGGGGGGSYGPGANASAVAIGGSGGSGGGGASSEDPTNYSGGIGVAGQGNNGGFGSNKSPYTSGGGGGATSVGGNAGSNAGNGGSGASSSITGVLNFYSGGGGGGSYESSNGSLPGTGGSSIGGNGGGPTNAPGTNAIENTGSGGGGGGYPDGVGGNGSSGIVVIKIPTPNYTGIITGSPSVTTNSLYTILTYTGSGTYTT